MERFPDITEEATSSHFSPNGDGQSLGRHAPLDRWQARKSSWHDAHAKTPGRGHGRQKSLSEAVRTIRTRSGSVSANVHEISDALKVPVSPRLIVLCIIWYLSSALTNTSSKTILNTFPNPATLTLIQFAFVACLCVFFAWLAESLPALKAAVPSLRHGLRSPSREVIRTTMPMAVFQIGGHLLSSTATARIPVSLVHTIKGLSPLFTVFAYRLLFNIRYPTATYLSLIPLTLGVMLACATHFRANILGIMYALAAALIFVTQNIWSKRLFNEAAIAESTGSQASRKLDKLNLLCYSSALAFVATFPIWFWSEGITLLSDFLHDGSLDLSSKPHTIGHGRLALEFLFNGVFHFAQNILAFVLLSMVSPVTYSVASLIKRVFVVIISMIWFQNPTTRVQGFGIALTFLGLYLYDRTKEGNRADRKAKMLDTKGERLDMGAILPLHVPLAGRHSPANGFASGGGGGLAMQSGAGNGYAFSPVSMLHEEDRKKDDDRDYHGVNGVNGTSTGGQAEGGSSGSVGGGGAGSGRAPTGKLRRASNATWLPPGVRQEA